MSLMIYNSSKRELKPLAGTPSDSVELTGTPTAPTPAQNSNDSSIATTAFVKTAISAAAPSEATTSTAGLMPAADKAKLNGIATAATANAPYTSSPLVNGIASAGSSALYARGDHVHPSDTNRVPIIGKGINLFENWYLMGDGAPGTFPIHQRYPNNEYDSSTDGKVCIDRWRHYNRVSVTSQWGLVLLSNGGTIFQTFNTSLMDELNGKEVTVSALTWDGYSCYSGTIVYEKAPSAVIDVFSDGYFRCQLGTDGLFYFTNLQTTESYNIGLRAIKLELGTQQTLARNVGNTWVLNDPPPNYQQELAKCQRYLQVIKTNNPSGALLGSGYVNTGVSSRQILVTVPLSVPMNPIQAVTPVGVGLIVNGGIQTLESGSLFAQAGNIVTLQLISSVDITAPFAPATAYILYDGYLLLSAE